MKIYTKTGDKGQTSLANGQRVSKTDPRIEAYGTADELNSFIGLLRSKADQTDEEQLNTIQNKLFNLGALLAGAEGEWITDSDVALIEQWIDNIQKQQEPLRAFVLPAGNETVSIAHICRTITRRLERQMLALPQECNITPCAFRWINRLSDFLFVWAICYAKIHGNKLILWKK
ncbi:MAG: cob(I)yrinic acid a,c-diamide adenosyltransferase [Paludibacteraceae bacterium]|nr:cob(I)yrinic acid a,c-diamide adenosyltransferase [Paludibacteraceae bacterium]